MLLAWTGVLWGRLSRGERRVAARRVREVAAAIVWLEPRDAVLDVADGDFAGMDASAPEVVDFGGPTQGYTAS